MEQTCPTVYGFSCSGNNRARLVELRSVTLDGQMAMQMAEWKIYATGGIVTGIGRFEKVVSGSVLSVSSHKS